jgi:cytochrome c-type biogenesis protein CcmH
MEPCAILVSWLVALSSRGRGVAVTVLGALFLLAAAPGLASNEGITLSPEQEARARAINDQLIAPCCFSQTVANHNSPIAEQIKAEVRQMLAAGSSDREIIDFYVGKYGERILATPRASGFNLLAYVMPGIALVAGVLGVVIVLRRWRRPRSLQPVGAGPSALPSDEARRYQALLEEELARFEG